jgi:hypothetical protein
VEALAVAGDDKAGLAERFLDDLISTGLITKDNTQRARPLSADWEAKLHSADGFFSLQVFDDLAELITADPIHDADEKLGWPVLRDT